MLLEKEYVANANTVSREEQEHNALINERYNQLKNAVAGQFAEEKAEQSNAQAAVMASLASVYRPSFDYASALAQQPTVTEYVTERPVQTAAPMQTIAPTQTASVYTNPTFVADVTPIQQTSVRAEESIVLTPFAKVVMAVFTVLVVAMLAMISMNTQTITQKEMRLQQLQQERAELIEQGQEIQRRIEEAKSEETIREYAESQGMVKVNP